jgi:hypothetical protein
VQFNSIRAALQHPPEKSEVEVFTMQVRSSLSDHHHSHGFGGELYVSIVEFNARHFGGRNHFVEGSILHR